MGLQPPSDDELHRRLEEIRSLADNLRSEARWISEEMERREASGQTPEQRRQRIRESNRRAGGAAIAGLVGVSLWFIQQARDRPSATMAAILVAALVASVAVVAPQGPPDVPGLGKEPSVILEPPHDLPVAVAPPPSPTVTGSLFPTIEPHAAATPDTSPGPEPPVGPEPTSQPPPEPSPTRGPTPVPTVTAPPTPDPTRTPDPTSEPTPTPTVTPPPEPTETPDPTPTPTPSPTPSPTPTQPDGRDPLIRICLALPPLLRLECLELLTERESVPVSGQGLAGKTDVELGVALRHQHRGVPQDHADHVGVVAELAQQ